MKIKHGIKIMAMTVALLVGPVFGQLQLVDNFDHYNTGTFDNNWATKSPNGVFGGSWTPATGNVSIVNVDGSKVLQVRNHGTAGARVSMIRNLTAPIINDQTGILFFRFKILPVAGYATDSYAGAHDKTAATFLKSDIIAGFGLKGPADATTLDIVTTSDEVLAEGTVTPGLWYNAWIVADQITDTFDLYISSAAGPAGTPALPQSADRIAAGLPFSYATTQPISGAMFLCPGATGATTYFQIDELHWIADYWTAMPRVKNCVPAHQTTLVQIGRASCRERV